MSTITTINASDVISDSRSVINTNFANLNTDLVAVEADRIKIGGDIGGTITTPTVTDLTITSEATGDILYRGASSWLRLAKGTDGKILKLASGIPAWETEITVEDASVTVKGVTEEATEAEVDANTAAGGTSARLFVNPSTLVTSKYGVQLPTTDEKDALAGTGTPGTGNEYVTDDDTSNATTADKVVRYTAGGDVNVPTTPGASQDASSKAYVDTKIKEFGAWATPISADTPYQATTDGFVVAYISSTNASLSVKSDAASTPTVVRCLSISPGTSAGAACTVPVREDDYVLVEDAIGTAVIFWIPLNKT